MDHYLLRFGLEQNREPPDTITLPRRPGVWIVMDHTNGLMSIVSQPFGSPLPWAVLASGEIVVADDEQYMFQILSQVDTTAQCVFRRVLPLPIPDNVRAREVRQVIEYLKTSAARTGLSSSPYVRSVTAPGTYPPILGMVVDAHDNLWVQVTPAPTLASNSTSTRKAADCSVRFESWETPFCRLRRSPSARHTSLQHRPHRPGSQLSMRIPSHTISPSD